MPCTCINCQKDFKTKHRAVAKYCSNACQADFQRKQIIKDWLEGRFNGNRGNHATVSRSVKYYMFELNRHKCQKCGWGVKHPQSGKAPLQVHHKDGNSQNSHISNLELLCPNCHSLTDNFGSRNRGRGRHTLRRLTRPK